MSGDSSKTLRMGGELETSFSDLLLVPVLRRDEAVAVQGVRDATSVRSTFDLELGTSDRHAWYHTARAAELPEGEAGEAVRTLQHAGWCSYCAVIKSRRR
eukprot:CAMPEP_0202811186 /NCGR_PEP_ID=MMETSP1389-20130828/3111_1 /ASSEMBLY_ACC=CAM_ASM_000865 /TAXON_ID=302021 /ORGANISM="Rhodomonas sp., Strain CCMP768" /LENGTH=99 /DNA_ID=CAMNT_0049482259 /DNA_START=281 /DNA_END=578 /DNA_ORIENTATION=+